MASGSKHCISILETGVQFTCSSDEALLRSMEQVAKKAIPVGCRNGGCGVCKVEIVSGEYRKGLMSRSCVTVEEEQQGAALACRVFPESDLTVRVIGKVGRRIATEPAGVVDSVN